jgi:hypothetical protein
MSFRKTAGASMSNGPDGGGVISTTAVRSLPSLARPLEPRAQLCGADLPAKLGALAQLLAHVPHGIDISEHFEAVVDGCLRSCAEPRVRCVAYRVLRSMSGAGQREDLDWASVLVQMALDFARPRGSGGQPQQGRGATNPCIAALRTFGAVPTAQLLAGGLTTCAPPPPHTTHQPNPQPVTVTSHS